MSDTENDQIDPNEEITILIADDESTHRFNREVTVGVNGAVVKVPIGTEYKTKRAVAHALENVGISFSEVEPKGETGTPAGGVSAGVTSVIAGEGDVDVAQGDAQATGTAALNQRQDDGETPAIPELRNEPNTVHIETDVSTSQLNTGDPAAGSTAHLDGQSGGSNANGTGAGNVGDSHDETGESDTSALDGSLADLKGEVANLNSDAVDRHIAAEKAGKNRAGALSLLEARKAELNG